MNTRTIARLLPLIGLALLGLARAGHAQVAPGDINKTQIRPSAHALGLGGSYLLLGDDPNGIITNPAAVGLARHASPLGLDFAAEGQTSNVNVGDLTSVINKLKDLRDQLNGSPNNSGVNTLQAVDGSFNTLYDYATANAGSGSQARISGSLSLGAAARWAKIGPFSVGLAGFDGVIADTRLTPSTGTQQPGGIGDRILTAEGGALNFANVGIPLAYQLPGHEGIVGLMPKYVRADYAAFYANANETNNTLTGTAYNEVNSSTFDLDAGYTSSRFTFGDYTVQGAAVVRHVIAPSFSLANSPSSGPAHGPSNFNFTLSPEVDLGVSGAAYGVRVVGEVHDLNGTNGGGATYHVGAEYAKFGYIVPRIGYDNNAFVYGLGISVGPLLLDAAASTNPLQRAAVDLSFNLGL